jgi:HTH-type transcriptional regulator/antitoxin HigA
MIKLIKTPDDHAAALRRVDELMALDPAPGSAEFNELEVIAHLAEAYEKDRFPVDLPDPVEAIKFRMEQQGLTQRDLVPYFGTVSRVSEVLSRKRPLNLATARKLHEGLGIPAAVLLAGKGEALPAPVAVERFPFAEMLRRGWFGEVKGGLKEARKQAEELLQAFFGQSFDLKAIPAFYRQKIRSGSAEDPYAVCAWKTRVLALAGEQEVDQPFNRDHLSATFLQTLVGLSVLRDGPRTAGELLRGQGIRVVIEPQLPGTHLDGAALLTRTGEPVIALTLRHDRIDNFWFTLLHEVAHVKLHLGEDDQDAFFDDLDAAGADGEAEADAFAANLLIPENGWQQFRQRRDWSVPAVTRAARSWNISPAIVAGRVRRETRNHRILTSLLGYRQVRAQWLPS